ncbi:DUF3298/DUF4163 domain-containing protein [bacterium]|nr:MAG: DUF3298/DUF4163 domain-containing protein [bacterium]
MKLRHLFLLTTVTCSLLVTSSNAASDDPLEAYPRTWKNVASLRSLTKNSATLKVKAVYPVFSGTRPVAQVAGLVIKRDVMNGFESFVKNSQGSKDELGLRGNMKYEYLSLPTLEMNRPRLISATSLLYEFSGGAHGNSATATYVFGYPVLSSKPRRLKLSDFFTDGDAAYKRVHSLLMAKLRATKGKEQYASFIIDGEVKSLSRAMLETFVATPTGLKWYFDPYAVAPYAAGSFEVKATIKELGPKFRAAMLK